MVVGDLVAGERAPRVCGDDPANSINWNTYYLCSPRMRG